MKIQLLIIVLPLLCFTSCIVQSPKYTTIEKVKTLKLGMTKPEVEELLGLKPYDVKSFNDSCNVYIYIYRVTDRRTVFLNTKPVNGKATKGRYIQLDVAFSKEGKVMNIETCRTCLDNLMVVQKLDIEKVIVFATSTIPAILVYIGLKKATQ